MVHHAICSDHNPISLDLCNVAFTKKQFSFKFEYTWLKEPNFYNEGKNYWEGPPSVHLMPKLIYVSLFMAKYGRIIFHKFRDKVCKQSEILNKLAEKVDMESVGPYFLECEKLYELFLQEKVYWKQRAKVFLLEHRDSNLNFFYAYALVRKKNNFLSHLKMDGRTIVIEKDINMVLLDYFNSVFTCIVIIVCMTMRGMWRA